MPEASAAEPAPVLPDGLWPTTGPAALRKAAPTVEADAASLEFVSAPEYASLFCPSCARVSSGYGKRRDPITRRRRQHTGVDIARPAGTEVYAWMDGVVLNRGRMKRYGLTVDIRHDNGKVSRYAHLKKATVVVGQEVEAGEVIGLVGRTGRTTGANLHFEIAQDGRRGDPSLMGIDFSRLVGPLPRHGELDHLPAAPLAPKAASGTAPGAAPPARASATDPARPL
ncbi:MAG: M23 family metallopeptidase [Desulfovibrio sp.]|nr:M23 family metallopeptidase [Desulfovibrio sp.]